MVEQRMWIINLKAMNSSGTDCEKTKNKYNVFISKKKIGIGWPIVESKKTINDLMNAALAIYPSEKAAKTAFHAIEQIQPGDYVITKNPNGKERYICVVEEKVSVLDPQDYKSADLSCACPIKDVKQFYNSDIPAEMTYRQLISRGTIRQIKNPKVKNAMIGLFLRLS